MNRPGLRGAVLLASVVLCQTAQAQVTTGTILGTVTDQSGGVLATATITATNLDTQLDELRIDGDLVREPDDSARSQTRILGEVFVRRRGV